MSIPVQSHFQAALSAMNISGDVSVPLWDEIEARYGEAHRHYHRLEHIAAMLDHAEILGVDDPLLALAIIYHDIIYDPARSDNEAQSAGLFRAHLGPYIPSGPCDQVCAMIEATKHHQPTGDDLTDFLLDLDMAILGASWSDYAAYAEGVAREYVPVYGNEAYRAGRAERFLKIVLAQPRIFLNPAFDVYEAQARDNLGRELAGLVEAQD